MELIMSEQEYEISSPPPSLFFSDNDEISFDEFEQEKVPLYLKDFEEKSEKNSYETFEEQDKIIDYAENIEFTPCVIVDFVKGKIQRCGETTKLRQLRNLFGTWQVDREAIKEVDGVLSRLGVCDSHFQFDNKYLHKSQNKQVKDFNQGIIQWRHCISCNKYITYFSRGEGCTIHSWKLNKQNVQVPCIGQYSCEALRVCPPICKRAFDDIKQQQCVCCTCYENLGGHIHHRPGKGNKTTTCITEELHFDDTTKGLEYLGNWLINVAQTTNNEIKKNILTKIFETLFIFREITSGRNITSNTNTSTVNEEKISLNEPPSLLMIKILFKEISKRKEKESVSDYGQLGHEFGKKLWNSRSEINLNKNALECPQTIQEYYNAFPDFLNNFFFGMVDELYQRKATVCNLQRKNHQKPTKEIIPDQIIKIVTSITSMLLNLAFPYLKIWLPRILASLGRMPRLLGSFRQLLNICHITSHTDRHERKLAKDRMEKSDPTKRLIKGNNIWKMAIIDNIDFKEKSFKFGNIYDVTRDNSHATLRMVFQIYLPFEVVNSLEPVVELTTETSLFGNNENINDILMIFQQTIDELLGFEIINDELTYKKDFDADTVKYAIISKLNPGCLGPSPDVIILEPGANPNSDEEILRVAEMYKEDFSMEDHSFLDIVADEAIYRRLIRCRDKWPKIRPILGAWHTSKDFCSVLIVLFSSYGLLSLASRLGVRFLDKFEMTVDYRSTARVLDLIWVAVGVAISIYINKNGMSTFEIMDGDNSKNICLKIWYMYFKWAGIWKTHRMAMRIGNFDLQRDALSAASPLFASAAKFNYTTALAHFLSTIATYPKLEEKLRYCCSFKVPNENPENAVPTCFGFDEALETFGVKFVKQHVNRNVIDEKNLKDQIKGIQDERERIDLLMSEYLGDHSISSGKRAVKSRKESLWELVHDLITVFGMENSLSHPLFQNYPPTEIHKEGLDRLIACYPDGLERIKKVYLQEVLGVERKNTQGRRAVGVVRTKVRDYSQKKAKEKKKTAESHTEPAQIVIAEGSNKRQFDLNEPRSNDTTEPQFKKRKTTGSRHHTTKDETDILSALKDYKDKLPDNAISSVREHLSDVWTIKKVREWWYNHKEK